MSSKFTRSSRFSFVARGVFVSIAVGAVLFLVSGTRAANSTFLASIQELFGTAPVRSLDKEKERMTVVGRKAETNPAARAAASENTATISTDKPDYAPGETVHITGTGWQPGERVQLTIVRDRVPVGDDDTETIIYEEIADLSASISNSDYVVFPEDIGATFYLTALGLSSGLTAEVVFTDGVPQLDVFPAWLPTNPGATRFSAVVRVTGGTPNPGCVRVVVPTGYTGVSLAGFTTGVAGWSSVVDGNVVRLSGPALTSGTSTGWARFEIDATPPAAQTTEIWDAQIGNTTTGTSDCLTSTSNDQQAVRTGDPLDRTFTVDFRDAAGNVISEGGTAGTPRTYRMRITNTSGALGDDAEFIAIGLPPCFSDIKLVSTTTNGIDNFAVATNFNGNVIRLENGILRENLATDDYVEVKFTATPGLGCSGVFRTTVWANDDTLANSKETLAEIFTQTGSDLGFIVAGPAVCDITVDGTGAIPGSYLTIQEAVDVLPNPGPCTITVMSGTYNESVVIDNINDLATLESQRIIIRRDPAVALGAVIVTPDNLVGSEAYHAFDFSDSKFVTLHGFSIGPSVSPALVGSDRQAIVLRGGANTNSDIVISSNDINNNGSGGSGGSSGGIGIGGFNARTWVVNNLIRANNQDGATMGFGGSTGAGYPKYFVNNTFFANTHTGLSTPSQEDLYVINNLFVGNGTSTSPGLDRVGINSFNASIPSTKYVVNNVFYNNRLGDLDDPAAWFEPASTTDLGNRTTFGTEGAPGVATPPAGCTFADCSNTHLNTEIFVNPAAGDFHLVVASPAVDAGVNSSVSSTGAPERVPAVDFEGTVRPQGALVDAGFDEFLAASPATADVSITKSDGNTTSIPGNNIVYTITATNPAGGATATNVTVADTFGAQLNSCSYTSVAAGGATGNDTGPTNGDINDSGITMPANSSVTYTATCNIGAASTGNLVNTATIASPDVTDPDTNNNTASDTNTLTPSADVSITKTDGVTTATPGGTVTYSIVVTNNGPSVASGVTVTDTFGAPLSGCSTTVGTTGTVSGQSAGPIVGNINESGISMSSGATITYTATCNIASDATGTLSNTASATSTTADPSTPNDATDNDTTLTPSANVSITKTDNTTTATPGGQVTYTIVASNTSGPSTATGVTVTDNFPGTLTCSTTSIAAGGAIGNDPGAFAGNISDSGITLPVGGSVTYTAVCTVDPAATGTLSNTATITSGVGDPTPGNNSQTDNDTALTPSADVSITKTDNTTTATPGGQVTYTIVASNAGPSAATGVTVTDTFPASLTCSTTSIAAGGATGNDAGAFAGNISDSGITLPVGGSVTYTATCTIDPAATGTLSNTATITSGVGDPTPGNNSQTDNDTALTPSADVSITKTDNTTTATPGGQVTYTIVASNAGPSAATGVTVTDTFPASLTCSTTSVTSGGATGNNAGAFAGNISDSGITLPAGGSVTYTATCTIDPAATGTLSNTATITSGVGDPNAGNNSQTDSDTVLTPQPVLTINKVVVGDTVGRFNLLINSVTYATNVGNGGTTGAQTAIIGANTFGETGGTVPTTNLADYSTVITGTGCVDNGNGTGSITLAAGNNAVCTITNTRKPRLTVTKVVNNAGGGTKSIGDFPLFVDGNPVASGVQNNSTVGAHTVSETADPNYTAAFSGDCAANGSITLAAGDVKTCTITNTFNAPKITVTKIVNNAGGGTKVVGDFPLFVDGNPVTSGVQVDSATGLRTVSETVDPDYTAVIGGDCAANGTITLTAGQVASCTITNTYRAPRLTVTKVVVNDNGGTKTVADFPLFIDATPVVSGAQNASTTGAHTVSETLDPDYSSTITGDCAADGSITLAAGDVKTCTITNNDIAPSLTLDKVLINDNGGLASESSFTLTANGGAAGSLSGPGAAGSTDVTSGPGFNAGTYALSEAGPVGYSASPWSCVINGGAAVLGSSIIMAPGDVAVCTITNDDGAVSISGNIQQLNPPFAPSNVAGVLMTLTGPNVPVGTTTTTDAAGNYTFNGLAAGGTYTVTPSMAGKTFDPLSRTYTALLTDVTNANFRAFNADGNGSNPRNLRAENAYTVGGSPASVPFILTSLGNEALVKFRFTYDPTVVNSPVASCGAASGAGCSIIQDTSVPGIVDVTVNPENPTYLAGQREVAVVTFNTSVTNQPQTPLIFTAAGNLTQDAFGNPLLTSYSNGYIVFQQGIECDLAERYTGDGMFESDDGDVMRQFIAGMMVNRAYNEYQRADCAPFASKGDGVLDATDLQLQALTIGVLSPQQTAGGPFEPLPAPTPFAGADSEGGRAMRVVSATAGAGDRVTVAIELDAQGDETAASFTLAFDPMKLANPQVAAAAAGARLTSNTGQAAEGRVMMLIDGIAARGTQRMVTVTFDVLPRAASGETLLYFTSDPTGSAISDKQARSLATRFTAGTVTISGPNAEGISVSGRVLSPEGPGLRNAKVILTDADGISRSIFTSSLGYYEFDGVKPGRQYSIAVTSKRYRFMGRMIEPSSSLSEVDFIAQE